METYFQKYIAAGGIMMYFIIPCSFLAVGYILQGFISIRNKKIIPHNLLRSIKAITTQEEFDKFFNELQEDKSTFGKALYYALQHIKHNRPPVIEDIISEEITILYQRTNTLNTLYIVSPMLGLLGTILGIMNTFENFSTTNGSSISDLSMGINEALITTEWGLFIAIPCFIFLHIFRNKIFNYEKELLPRLLHNSIETLKKFASITSNE